MKNIIKLLIVTIPLYFSQGCTDTMEDMDYSPYELNKKNMRPSGLVAAGKAISPMFKNYKNVTGTWMLQVQESLNAGSFSGYFMHPNLFNASGAGNNDDYKFNSASWNDFIYSSLTTSLGAYNDLNEVVIEFDDAYEVQAMGLVLKVLAASMAVDAFGPFPYLNYGEEFAPFDDPKDIYIKGFLPELDRAIDTLVFYSTHEDPTIRTRVTDIKVVDISTFQGDLTKWVKLANTVRLRLAMRMSDPDPKYTDVKAIAQTYITKCLDPKYGVLDATTGNFSLNLEENGCTNPYLYQSEEWKDLVLGADIYSFLDGYNDPRLPLWFKTSDTLSQLGFGSIYGAVRPGCQINVTRQKGYEKFSLVNSKPFDIYPLVLAAEGVFLLAEANLKGFATAKTAKEYYEEGVKTSLTTWGISSGADTYLAGISGPKDYVDFLHNENSYSATTNVTPKWDEAKAMEQIMTQKWIALFPDAHNAWSEFRRTGFPKLKIPKRMDGEANWDNSIPAYNFVNRLPYPNTFKNTNPSLPDAVSKYLNGKDDGFQRLFWQKNNNVCDY